METYYPQPQEPQPFDPTHGKPASPAGGQPVTPMGRKKYWHWIVIVALLVAAGGLVYYVAFYNSSEGEQNNPAPLDTVTVHISNTGFAPGTVTIRKGGTVTWINDDSAIHTVTSDNGNGPMSPELGRGSVYNDTFITTGTYAYHCSLHPEMKGTVTVVE